MAVEAGMLAIWTEHWWQKGIIYIEFISILYVKEIFIAVDVSLLVKKLSQYKNVDKKS